MKKKRVIVGMSGGVDSSVVAALIKRQGHQVCGVFMRNWEERGQGRGCNASKDYDQVKRICDFLDIECQEVNLSEQYWKRVFSTFLKDCKSGLTPNPDILCNREIKFHVFLKHALELGADFVATGHYCRVDRSLGYPRLQKGVDPNKDQSYFLQAISEKALENVVFPIGHLEKKTVRAMAFDMGLDNYDRKDSVGICFVGKRSFPSLLKDYLHEKSGPIINLKGEKLGVHQGLFFYTVGQRKGLGLGGAGDPFFVVEKDFSLNALVVERGERHSALYTDRLWLDYIHWINKASEDIFLSGASYSLSGKIRYRQKCRECLLTPLSSGGAEVFFPAPERAVTPGQYMAFYQGDICLGGGQIVKREKSYYHRKLSLPRYFSSEAASVF